MLWCCGFRCRRGSASRKRQTFHAWTMSITPAERRPYAGSLDHLVFSTSLRGRQNERGHRRAYGSSISTLHGQHNGTNLTYSEHIMSSQVYINHAPKIRCAADAANPLGFESGATFDSLATCPVGWEPCATSVLDVWVGPLFR